MAFTSAQATSIRKYLGYPQLNRYRDTRLEDAITVVGADVDASAEVLSMLSTLADVETKLSASLKSAGLKRVDVIEWYPATSSSGASPVAEALRSEGRVYCSRLSALFGVPILTDPFGTGGYQDDSWMGVGSQYGGPIPMG